MKKLLSIFTAAFLMLSILSCPSWAADLDKTMDKFYNGLADIIERNMNNPDICVTQVEDYYRKNEKTVTEIREELAKALEQAAPMMEQMMPMAQQMGKMNEKQMEAFKKQQEKMEKEKKLSGGKSAGADRYGKALQIFSEKYPMHGLQIAMKGMQFVPNNIFTAYQKSK